MELLEEALATGSGVVGMDLMSGGNARWDSRLRCFVPTLLTQGPLHDTRAAC